MRSTLTHWLYLLSTVDFATNLGYSLVVVGDAAVLGLTASVGRVGVVNVGAAAAEIVTSRTAVGGAADGLPAHPVAIKATRTSSAGNLAWFIPSTPSPECRRRRCSPGQPQPARHPC